MSIFDQNEIREFVSQLAKAKDEVGMTWEEIAEACNEKFSLNRSESSYRKWYKKSFDEVIPEEEEEDEITTLRKLKVKISDERRQLNADVRALSREETLKEIAADVAHLMTAKKLLPKVEKVNIVGDRKYALLNIGDWHYGLEVENTWNEYNPDIAKARVAKLTDKTIEYCHTHHITNLIVNGLGDYISGDIHLPLRINTREDVITQTMNVAEIIAEMLATLSLANIDIELYTVYGNHGRVMPNKKESLHIENFERFIDWYLVQRLADNANITIHPNYGDFSDTVIYDVNNWRIGIAHGDNDSVPKAVHNMTLMTRKPFDLIVTAHKHHLSAEETNGCLVIGNPCLIGVDDYSYGLRATSYPAQTLIIIGEDSPIECVYYIRLDNLK